MAARYGAILAMLLLGGCASLPDLAQWVRPSAAGASASSEGRFRFDWRMSGDPEVAPAQVFDNGRRMWLQFEPGQAIPAIFGRKEEGGYQLLDYRREGPYVVLEAVWRSLQLRGGALVSDIELLDGMAAAPSIPVLAPTPPPAEEPQAQGVASAESPAVPSTIHEPDVGTVYEVGPADQNMRRALAKWAGHAGWTFDVEHWAVDADIPLTGSAQFRSNFKQAVQALMQATELGDRPLQPCFYSNKVLRIVPYAQPCNRLAVAGVPS